MPASITMFILPPGIASTSHTGLVTPLGPHHLATSLESVHALHTMSSEASNVLVISSSLRVSFVCAIQLSFSVYVSHRQALLLTYQAVRSKAFLHNIKTQAWFVSSLNFAYYYAKVTLGITPSGGYARVRNHCTNCPVPPLPANPIPKYPDVYVVATDALLPKLV